MRPILIGVLRTAYWVTWLSPRLYALGFIGFVFALAFGAPQPVITGLLAFLIIGLVWLMVLCCVGLLVRIFAPPRLRT